MSADEGSITMLYIYLARSTNFSSENIIAINPQYYKRIQNKDIFPVRHF